MLEKVWAHPLVPAVILASILGVLLLRYLNRKPSKPDKPRPQQRPRRKKRR